MITRIDIKPTMFKLTEEDNVATAMAKAGLETTVKTSVGVGVAWGVVFVAGKVYQKVTKGK